MIQANEPCVIVFRINQPGGIEIVVLIRDTPHRLIIQIVQEYQYWLMYDMSIAGFSEGFSQYKHRKS